MAFNENNSISDFGVLTNPFANGSNVMELIGIDKVDNCQYLAVVSAVVAAGGATATVTPITGNLDADLNHYTVTISDGINPPVSNQLSLAARTTPFVVNTSSLDPTAPWNLMFSGAEGGNVKDAPCELCYNVNMGIIGVAGGTVNTTPAIWTNVSFLLKLTSTDDAAFDLFPAEGLEIANGDTVNLIDFLTTDTQLNKLGSYVFTIEMKKKGTEPVAAAPVPPSNDVFLSLANTVTFPYALPKIFAEVNNAVTIKTSVAGTFSENLPYALTGDGIDVSVSFTLTTDVAV